MYEIELHHDGLNKYRHIRGRDPHVVEEKARVQRLTWDLEWEKKVAREEAAMEKQANKEAAADQTAEAQAVLDALRKTLEHTLSVDDAVDWESLKDRSSFGEPAPKPAIEPSPGDVFYQADIGFFDFLIPGAKRRKREHARKLFAVDHENFLLDKKKFQTALERWEARKKAFNRDQEAKNSSIDEQKVRYLSKEPQAIEEYCDLVLSRSQYPEFMPQEFELEFNSESGLLVVDYRLPSLDDLPTLKQVKYVQSRNELDEVFLKETESNKLYDEVLYQICLRTIHEIFEADSVDCIGFVAVNGWVEFVDKGTGNEERGCIISVQAARDEFLLINLAKVNPKECFKRLKGVGSSKLHGMAPVVPVVRMSREDSRFVQSVDVVEKLDEGTNLAAIDWQDFEHLIRELFEKEFSPNGGEVKVTQASRDGGVDAIAFDPDPIRGGKIVIQAKRYTNVVGVSAVRDLYGTVVNEGATKGVLVTTSSYGPDAYGFASDKPITLLDGGNLLHLLAKHGHKARIDLQEAKALAATK